MLKNINQLKEIKWDSIDEWLETDFMKMSVENNRGTILRSQVASIEEGKELYALWQEKFARKRG